MDYASKNTSLNWYDAMMIRILKHYKGENRWSLEHADIGYMFKLAESLDIDDFINEVYENSPPPKPKP